MVYQIREGIVVRLKSGGPEMTVEKDLGNGRCVCAWFDGKTLRREEFFNVAVRFVAEKKD